MGSNVPPIKPIRVIDRSAAPPDPPRSSHELRSSPGALRPPDPPRSSHELRSCESFDKARELAQVATLVHSVAVLRVGGDDRVAGVPVLLGLGVQPPHPFGLIANVLEHPGFW